MQNFEKKQKWSKPLGKYYCSKMLQAHAIAMQAWGRKSWSLDLQHACRGLLFSCWSVKWKTEQCNLSLHKLNTILNCSEVVHCYQFNSPCLVSSSAFCGLHSLPGYVSLYKPQQKLLKPWCLGSCAYPAKSNQKHIYKYRYEEENTIYTFKKTTTDSAQPIEESD